MMGADTQPGNTMVGLPPSFPHSKERQLSLMRKIKFFARHNDSDSTSIIFSSVYEVGMECVWRGGGTCNFMIVRDQWERGMVPVTGASLRKVGSLKKIFVSKFGTSPSQHAVTSRRTFIMGTTDHFIKNNTIFKLKHKIGLSNKIVVSQHTFKTNICFPLIPKCLFKRV